MADRRVAKARSRAGSPVLAVLAVLAGACGTSEEPAEAGAVAQAAEVTVDSLDPASWNVAAGDEGAFLLAWQPRGSAGIPRNEEATLDVLLFRANELHDSETARVSVRGWMPDHEHGLVRIPRITREGAGRYTIEGLLLHMRGHWQLFFDVVDGPIDDTVAFELDL